MLSIQWHRKKKMKSRLLTVPALHQCTGTMCSNIPGWKGSRVSSVVREYSWEIRDIRAANHTEITHNTHPRTHNDSACYACTCRYDKHRILRVIRGTTWC